MGLASNFFIPMLIISLFDSLLRLPDVIMTGIAGLSFMIFSASRLPGNLGMVRSVMIRSNFKGSFLNALKFHWKNINAFKIIILNNQ